MKKIDWDKPYSTICGTPPFPGVRHMQGGRYYSPKGNEVEITRQMVVAMKDDGMTDTEIGETLGITRQKVTKILCG